VASLSNVLATGVFGVQLITSVSGLQRHVSKRGRPESWRCTFAGSCGNRRPPGSEPAPSRPPSHPRPGLIPDGRRPYGSDSVPFSWLHGSGRATVRPGGGLRNPSGQPRYTGDGHRWPRSVACGGSPALIRRRGPGRQGRSAGSASSRLAGIARRRRAMLLTNGCGLIRVDRTDPPPGRAGRARDIVDAGPAGRSPWTPEGSGGTALVLTWSSALTSLLDPYRPRGSPSCVGIGRCVPGPGARGIRVRRMYWLGTGRGPAGPARRSRQHQLLGAGPARLPSIGSGLAASVVQCG